MSLARELHKNGAEKITIVEKGTLGNEASFAAAGMLATQSETDKADDFFDFCVASSKLYPTFAEQLFDETGVDIELDTNGTLYLAFDEKDSRELKKRYGWQTKAGLKVEHLSAKETHKLEPFVSPDSLESLFFPNDWQIENRKLLSALRKYAELNEIKICEETEASELIAESGVVKGVKTSGGKEFFGDAVILATGAWTSFIKRVGSIVPTIKPIRGHMLSFRTAKRFFNHVIYSPRGYIVPRKLGKILAGATVEDVGFDKMVSDSEIERVRENAIEISPSLSGLPIDEKWSGLRPFAGDGLPVIGSVPEMENLFIATAHYRNGILLAPITARILSDNIIDGASSTYFEKFGIERFQTAKISS